MAYGQNTMMGMLDTKVQEEQQQTQKSSTGGGEYWNDVNDLSPVRKHLIGSYLQVSDEEAMPLLGEYFGVALSFVALGALVRASNSTGKRKQQQHRRATATTTDDSEGLNLRSCSRFQRMALESMLKESMERLRVLSQNAYQLEDRVKHLVEENFVQDRERVHLLNRLMEAEKAVQELRALRKAEGRANERVMGIVAAKEQDWIKEKRSLQKEAEKLKETMRTMTIEAKFHAQRCMNPICEHCQGIERIARSTSNGGWGRTSLRDLHSPRDFESSAFKGQMLVKAEQQQQQQEQDQTGVTCKADTSLEDEEDKIMLKAIEMRKSFNGRLAHLKGQQLNGEKRYTDCSAASDPGNEKWRSQCGGGASSSGSGLSGQSSTIQQGLTKQQENVESELANILKRVGILRQRAYSTVGVLGISPRREEPSGSPQSSGSLSSDEAEDLEPLSPLFVKGKDLTKLALVEEESPQIVVRGETMKRSTIVPEPSVLDPTFEIAEYASEHSYNSDESKDLNDIGDLDLDLGEEEDEEAFEMKGSPRQAPPILRDECAHESASDDEIVAAAGVDKLQTEEKKPLKGVANLASDDGSDERGSGGSQEPTDNRADATDAEPSLLPKEDLDDDDDGGEGKSACLNRLNDEECVDDDAKEGPATLGSSRDDRGADSAPPQGRDDYHSADPKQVLQVAGGRDNNEAPLPPSNLIDSFGPFSDSDATGPTTDRVDGRFAAADVTTSINSTNSAVAAQLPHLREGQEDIPIFERNNSDDLAGELPESEEKRVCGSDEPFDSSDAIPATVKSARESNTVDQMMNGGGLRGRAPVSHHEKAASVMDNTEKQRDIE